MKVVTPLSRKCVQTKFALPAVKRSMRGGAGLRDTAALLPKALRNQLVSEPQRSECASETYAYRKAEKFLGHLQRAVNGDNNKYYTFIQVLEETGQTIASIASSLRGD